MTDSHKETQNHFSGVSILIMVCVSVILFTLATGAAYTGIQSARLTAAKASLGQIESVYYLAEIKAEKEGLAPSTATGESLLKSFDQTQATVLSEYDRFILDTMLENFGPNRDFDFAISRYQDSGTTHIYVYYFPIKGRTDVNRDLHYLLSDGAMSEKNR